MTLDEMTEKGMRTQRAALLFWFNCRCTYHTMVGPLVEGKFVDGGGRAGSVTIIAEAMEES